MYRNPFEIEDLSLPLQQYFEETLEYLSDEAKKIYKTIYNNPGANYNREDLALYSLVRRGSLNNACLHLEALGLITTMSVGKSKPVRITKLGKTIYETFEDRLQTD